MILQVFKKKKTPWRTENTRHRITNTISLVLFIVSIPEGMF